MQTFAIFCNPGHNWVKGTPSRQQPLWDEHAAFMDKLFDEGVIVLAGPYADWSGALVIVEAVGEAAVRRMFHDDPWTVHDILGVGSVKEWTIFLDSRQKK
jgi:uncharacterized protein YciI